jgi:hypothetical protein
MSKTKQQQIFEKCVELQMPVHNFRNNTRCIFYKGFKFEEATKDDGSVVFSCYNTRSMRYKELTDEEMDIVIDHGVVLGSNFLSYKCYKGIIDKHSLTINNPNISYKSVDTARRIISNYEKMCDNILNIHKKHQELFV